MNSNKPHCKALTKNGLPCRAAPMPSGFCFFHAYPSKALELGRIGGRKNRRTKNQIENKISALGTVDSPSDRLESLFQALRHHEINPQQANVLMRITHEQILARETTVRDEEIAGLRRELEEIKSLIRMRDQELSLSGYAGPESESEDGDDGVDDEL
jgi:hypothetical protein